MKLVQAKIPEAEYLLLKKRAVDEHKTLQEVIREALKSHLLSDNVDVKDPFFNAFPMTGKTGRKEKTSADHDIVIYGGKNDIRRH
ncbi:MAG: hypothetical protein KIY10_10115 [Thermoplasmata archaeon]|nr:hypothetical protein [Candidatus Sysuiplasma jiujiangense]